MAMAEEAKANPECWSCETELTEENTEEFSGFDGGNHHTSTMYGGKTDTAPFIKCDACFNADIDRYLERLQE